ncbi:hypothetical protein Sru01_15880 [Sphaerisporangium rufum]|uniref:Uncharacterized protein n=1 Tax=Sphaerisporangium rufum TaxID=1381558 RepID=A0A919R1C8_9ACTN|nr:hypothetical protein [Sphaerisporangium rufum]GII76606.1 hypothetical protein Sru01_15880 [Sphaerisporangium rufum]
MAAAALPLSHVQEIVARSTAARTGHIVGMADVTAVRDMITAFSEIDERHGGQHGRSALVTYLRDDVAPMCRARFRTDEVRRQMLSAASRGVHLLGWKSYDAGQQGFAQRHYLQSYALAAESGIIGHDGFVMRTMAMQGLKLHHPEHCRALAETGLNRAKGRVDAQTEALFRVVHAHTLAKTGKRRAAPHRGRASP